MVVPAAYSEISLYVVLFVCANVLNISHLMLLVGHDLPEKPMLPLSAAHFFTTLCI